MFEWIFSRLSYYEWMFLFGLMNTAIFGIFAIMRTYYNRKSVKIQETMLSESRSYWGSWQKRSEDISQTVKKDVKKEVNEQFNKLELKLNGEKESKRLRRRTKLSRKENRD